MKASFVTETLAMVGWAVFVLMSLFAVFAFFMWRTDGNINKVKIGGKVWG
jgi:hypothetical protein